MSIVNVALLQMTAHGTDQGTNLKKGETYGREARDMETWRHGDMETWRHGRGHRAKAIIAAMI